MKNLFLITIISSLIWLTGCNIADNNQSYQREYVVEAYLEAGSTMSMINLSTTAPVDEVYSFQNFAVSNAGVNVYHLSEDGTDTLEVIPFRSHNSFDGVYVPLVSHTVQGNSRYDLDIVVPQDNNHQISSSTFVPAEFEVLSTDNDTVMYQLEKFEVTYTRSDYRDRQNYLIVTVIAQDTTNFGLTPFYADQLDNDDDDISKADFVSNSSGIVNEGNYEIGSDNTLTIRLPWLAVAFYGPQELQTSTIDDNIYDFRRSQNTQFGGSTLSPGEIYDVIDNVEGGTGVFGSYAVQKSNAFIEKPNF